ncbi:radical SAM protein [Candidatus Pacearchaeota archaeon]|nr:radical SAM protein [Candidatus Pacearchaeota archaeon]
MENNCAKEFMNLVNEKGLSQQELKEKLQEIYRKNLPPFAEILVNPHCPNKCKHCIYPEDYHCHNKTLGLETWKGIINNMYEKLEFRHFIFGGRGLNNTIIEIIRYLNKNFPDIKVGMIADGPAIKKYYDEICSLRIDHFDISVDGLKETHDEQRNFPGAFDITIEQIKRLLDGGLAKGNIGKLSILATLTTINKEEILPMIKYLNEDFGLKNFFITPVSTYAGRPDKSLKPSYEETIGFIKETLEFFSRLNDSYVSFNIYEDDIINYLRENYSELYNKLKPTEDFFEFGEESGNNEFHFFWYPTAINGCREFIVNCDGKIFTGLVQALGKIPDKFIFGDVLEINKNREDFFKRLIESPAFDFYVGYLS